MEECVFSGDDESQMTSVTYTPRSGEFEINENFIILENDEKSQFRPKYDTYEISANFFCRLLSLVYFFSFLSNLNQILGLFGSNGIYDSNTGTLLNNLNNKTFYEALSEFPSLYLIIPISDFTLRLLPLIGTVSSFLMFVTGFNCMYSFLFLWALKLSLVALFRTLPKTASDLLLLEVGFLSIFIFTPFKFFDKHTFEVPGLVKWSFRFLTYRVILLSGVYKVFLLKKVNIQHILMSIPLPTFFNYYLVGLVANYKFFNVVLTGLLIFFEVVLSVFLVTPYRSCRLFGGMSTLVYALVFSLLGNFGPFYILLMLCSLFCLDDQFLYRFSNWKYNPFCKTDQLMRKVSVDLVDNMFENNGGEENTFDTTYEGRVGDLENGYDGGESSGVGDSYNPVNNGFNDPVNAGYNNSVNSSYGNTVNSTYGNSSGYGKAVDDNNGFGSVYFNRIMSNLNYSRHREYIREFMNFDDKASGNVFSECLKKILKDVLLLFYLTVIFTMTFLLFLFRNYRGVKALVLFLFCVLLKSHCEAVKTKITFLQGQYTLFFLQALLIFEMLKNGPNTWSFLLWIGLIELQLSLSKKIDNLAYLAKMIIQSFLLVHLLLYNTKILDSSFRDVLRGTNYSKGGVTHSGPGLTLSKVDGQLVKGELLHDSSVYGSNRTLATNTTSINSFFSISNYKSVFPVGKERLEIVFEGTIEHQVTSHTHWDEFLFKRKPSKLDSFPYFVPFYDYALDQQLVVSFNTNYYANLGADDTDPDGSRNGLTLSTGSPPSSSGNSTDTPEEKEEDEKPSSEDSDSNGESRENNEFLPDVGNKTPKPSHGTTYTATTTPSGDTNRSSAPFTLVSPNDKYLFDIIKRLLMGSEDLNSLLSHNPFGYGKPKYVRVQLYKYHFSNVPASRPTPNILDNDTHHKHRHHVRAKNVNQKNWYVREFVRELVPPLSYTNPVARGPKPGANGAHDSTTSNADGTNSPNHTHTTKVLRRGSSGDTENTVDKNQSEIIHVVHTMPASDHKTVPLSMADSFNHTIPNVDGYKYFTNLVYDPTEIIDQGTSGVESIPKKPKYIGIAPFIIELNREFGRYNEYEKEIWGTKLNIEHIFDKWYFKYSSKIITLCGIRGRTTLKCERYEPNDCERFLKVSDLHGTIWSFNQENETQHRPCKKAEVYRDLNQIKLIRLTLARGSCLHFKYDMESNKWNRCEQIDFEETLSEIGFTESMETSEERDQSISEAITESNCPGGTDLNIDKESAKVDVGRATARIETHGLDPGIKRLDIAEIDTKDYHFIKNRLSTYRILTIIPKEKRYIDEIIFGDDKLYSIKSDDYQIVVMKQIGIYYIEILLRDTENNYLSLYCDKILDHSSFIYWGQFIFYQQMVVEVEKYDTHSCVTYKHFQLLDELNDMGDPTNSNKFMNVFPFKDGNKGETSGLKGNKFEFDFPYTVRLSDDGNEILYIVGE
ncbi:hypothetical protein MACJ_002391 [Theileria orientalis]|uniref:Integral membrane protein n=1 Tax=Theileria orientalis TaxID=68886 RepID=A0A976M8I0_THEOR|nr:hypothetical protein MACJ_002391 [Theileria orientalis]